MLTNALNLLELIEHQLAGCCYLAQQQGKPLTLGIAEPMVGIEQTAGVLAELGITLHRYLRRIDLATQVEQVGYAAHQLGVADAPEEPAARRLPCGEVIGTEWRLPDLHRVDACGFAAFGRKDHHAPVFEPGIAMTENRILQLAVDHVVGKQR